MEPSEKKLKFGPPSEGTKAPQLENPLPKLLALFRAKGLSTEDVAEITGVNLDAANEIVDKFGRDRFNELCTTYSLRVSKGSEERIKIAAELAISRCVRILSDPATSSKEVIVLARDFMDRHFGKALQRTEMVGTFQIGEGQKEIDNNLAAANKRLGELMSMRQKMVESRQPKMVEAQVIDVR